MEAELRFNTLKQQLSVFERNYQTAVGPLCEELEKLDAAIAQASEDQLKKHSSKCEQYEWSMPDLNDASAQILDNMQDSSPSEDLQKLYREAAKRFHPDFAVDEEDRERRTHLMQQINRAYSLGDNSLLEELLRENDQRPTASAPLGKPMLDSVQEKLTRVKMRLRQVLQDVRDLESSDLGQLYSQAQRSEGTIAGFLRDLMIAIRAELIEKKQILDELLNGKHAHE